MYFRKADEARKYADYVMKMLSRSIILLKTQFVWLKLIIWNMCLGINKRHVDFYSLLKAERLTPITLQSLLTGNTEDRFLTVLNVTWFPLAGGRWLF
jgi:hypothetical protein